MPMLSVYVDDETYARLSHESQRLGRSMQDLAESAVAEAALEATRDLSRQQLAAGKPPR